MSTGILSVLKTQIKDQDQVDDGYEPIEHSFTDKDYEAVENTIAETIADIRSEKPDMHVSSCSWR